MDWCSIALKNTWRSLRRYIGYLLASTVAVTIFCMFALFIDNTSVQHGYMTQTASELAVVCRVVVALFAIFFIFYFHAALMRMRNKEFGLLLTLGMTPRQVGWLIFNESLLLGVCALVMGCLLGIPASVLFLWIMGLILALPSTLPFILSANSFEVTLIFFGILFLVEAIIISLRVTGRTPKMLILGARVRQMPPRASLWRVLLGLFCIGVAYDLAVQFSFFILLTMIPIIALTIIGTYYLFSQVSVLLLKYLRGRALDGKHLLVVARLSYRMRDYARMLTVVSTLSACVLTGMGAIFGVLQGVQASATSMDPFAIQWSVNASHASSLTLSQIRQVIQAQHQSIQAETDMPFLVGHVVGHPNTTNPNIGYGSTIAVSIVSHSTFQHMRNVVLQAHPDLSGNFPSAANLASNETTLYFPPPNKIGLVFSGPQVKLQVGNKSFPLMLNQHDGRILNRVDAPQDVAQVPDMELVVSDALYAQLDTIAPTKAHWHAYGYMLSNWQQSQGIVDALRKQIQTSQQAFLTDTIASNAASEQLLSVMLFAGFFISCLFFLAAGCAIYFKLFNQQEEDRKQFHALERIGMQRSEVSQVLGVELLLLFFVPVLVGILHSVFAMLDLINLISFNIPDAAHSVLSAFGIICLLYGACFALYFWVSRVNYLRKMKYL